jgi:hypothetical protein
VRTPHCFCQVVSTYKWSVVTANAFFYQTPSRYIFPGAEVFYEPDDECSTSSESDGEDNPSAEEDNGYWEEEASQVKITTQPAFQQQNDGQEHDIQASTTNGTPA